MTTTRKSTYPSEEECMVLLDRYGTPERVRRHCSRVAQVAEAVAVELNRCGLKLDIPLVVSAAYLHDIARVHSRHDRAGAQYLRSIGLDKVADVMYDHTFHRIEHRGFLIDEEDVLCIADRLVLEDRYVGPEKRMEYIIGKAVKKFGEEKRTDLENSAREFIEYIHELEKFTGKRIEELL